ncbi:MAG TPA: phosphatidylinositol-specific phospholipase C/glycerophosphodiester phosphodiesterase family protein, partial [Polyangiales bacterium]
HDALAAGFTSVEADVWLVDGALLVAHDLVDVTPARTLEALYLAPLRARIAAQGGSVYAGHVHGLQLLIDIKSDGEPTYRALHEQLARYSDILTVFTDQGVSEGAVTAVISGNRPRTLMAAQRVRFAGYDGRRGDLGGSDPSSFIPLISDNWNNLFAWTGEGTFPEAQRTALHTFVATAHARGQRVRFWATPDATPTREAIWAELIAAGVDYLNTDDLVGLAAYLRVHDPKASVPQVDWFPAHCPAAHVSP